MKEPVNKLTFNHQLLAGSLKVFKNPETKGYFILKILKKPGTIPSLILKISKPRTVGFSICKYF
jgi:hypothetical protein